MELNINNCCLSIGVGILTYFLLYFNNLQNYSNQLDSNDKNLGNNNVSLKVPLIISLVVYYILNNTIDNNITHTISCSSNKTKDMDLFTDNLSYWF